MASLVLCREDCLDEETGGVQEAEAGDGNASVWPVSGSTQQQEGVHSAVGKQASWYDHSSSTFITFEIGLLVFYHHEL